jgi:enoyl-CoA hydratase
MSEAVLEARSDDIEIGVEGTLAVVTLNRPKALNALTTAMRAELAVTLARFARDPQVYAMLIRSASPKVFSVGGDVRETIAWARSDPERARRALADEYRLNWQLECFTKPTVSLIDGLVMGSGVGLTIFGTHRVAGEGYAFAMPETAIGLFPDVGVAHVLARLPGAVGIYLGLTGRTIRRADAYALGLATHCIPRARFDEFAAGVLADLDRRSPTSLAITLRHIQDAAARDLRQTLEIDYRLACRFLDGHDFPEGVRAVLIDKDNRPEWRPGRIEDVSEAMVDAYFAPLGAGELVLATRQEMQTMR